MSIYDRRQIKLPDNEICSYKTYRYRYHGKNDQRGRQFFLHPQITQYLIQSNECSKHKQWIVVNILLQKLRLPPVQISPAVSNVYFRSAIFIDILYQTYRTDGLRQIKQICRRELSRVVGDLRSCSGMYQKMGQHSTITGTNNIYSCFIVSMLGFLVRNVARIESHD